MVEFFPSVYVGGVEEGEGVEEERESVCMLVCMGARENLGTVPLKPSAFVFVGRISHWPGILQVGQTGGLVSHLYLISLD